MAMEWLSIGARSIYVKHYESDCKYIHGEHTLTKFRSQNYHMFSLVIIMSTSEK